MKEFLKRYGAYLCAAIVFVTLACVYCLPKFQGKTVYAGDNINGVSAVNECVEYTKATGRHSWWTGSMFSGMPNYQIGGGQYKSSALLKPFLKLAHKGHSDPVWVFILYFFCFFAVLRSFGVDKYASIAGAVAIGLSSYFIVVIAAGHNGKTSTIALMSVVAAGMHLIFNGRRGPGFIAASFFTAVGFSTHPQMAYYVFLLIGFLWIAELVIHVKSGKFRSFVVSTLVFAGAVGLGLGTGCSNVFANAEYARETMRGGSTDLGAKDGEKKDKGLDIEYATQWSYGKDETFTFLIPGFKGGSSSYPLGKDSGLYKSLVKKGVPAKDAASFCSSAPMYWGEQPFTAGNVYMGAVVCFLFLLGLFLVKGPYKWALLAATVLSTMLAWGHNCLWLTELFFKYFPLYGKFRAVSSILIVAEIAMPLLGFLAVQAIMSGGVSAPEAKKAVVKAGGITALVCLFFALAGPSLYDFTSSYDVQWKENLSWLYPDILAQRREIFTADCWRSLIFVLLASAVMYIYAAGKVKNAVLAAALGVLVIADMWPVDKRYFNDSSFVSASVGRSVFAAQPYEKQLMQDTDPDFRVFNLTASPFNDARTSYRLKSVGGYSAAKLRRYQDLIDQHLSKMHRPVLDMLNTKYYIVSGEDGVPEAVPNPDAMGNAWFVDSLLVVETPDEECAALMEVDLHTTAVVDRTFAESARADVLRHDDASVRLLSYAPDRLEYEYSSANPGTLVFSEIYYPYGWKASIDGVAAGHFRANYVLRAMNVPAGSHNISFVFDPDSVRKGDAIAVVCIIIMYLAAALIIFMYFRKRRGLRGI